jgi:dehydrogenase/reductase SDR family member 12
VNWQQFKKIVAFYGRYTLSYTQVGFSVRRLRWRKMKPRFNNQHWLVTGASGGLGRAIALSAVRAGARVTAVARSPEKLAALALEASTGLTTKVCDLSLQADVAKLIAELARDGRKIDVLVNNVGVLLDDFSLTAEQRETSFATNLLTHYQLTEGLIEHKLLARGGLVINMSSAGMYNVPLNVSVLNPSTPAKYSGVVAYGFHKRAQVALNSDWQRRYADSGLAFYVMHPGWADTDGVKRSLPRFRRILKSILRDEWSGSDTAIWLAAARPAPPLHDSIWFDRKLRPAHVYPHTRSSKDTAESLRAYLQRELAK